MGGTDRRRCHPRADPATEVPHLRLGLHLEAAVVAVLVRHRPHRARHLQPHRLGRSGLAGGRRGIDPLRRRHRRYDGHRLGLLPRTCRDPRHGLLRHPALLPGPAARPRHRRLPRRYPRPPHRHPGHRHRVDRTSGEIGQGQHPRVRPTRVRDRRSITRSPQLPHHHPGDPAQRDLPGALLRRDRRGHRHRRRRRTGIPRPVHPTAHADLGRHDRRRARCARNRTVDQPHALSDPLPDRAGHEPRR